ncbi:MAG: AAA family ATPase [Polyangiaceae bacterium]|jgi:energy-coupling factor transporter ATP-binding protein EcfA2|nr:AAA family ATPase [Polyangiaceae bacterium]
MLKRLKIHRFRTVRPGTELVFNAGFNVLLGRNGSGKTSLLDLISRVLRADFSDLREEEFDIEWEMEWTGKSKLQAHFISKRAPLDVDKALPRRENNPVPRLHVMASSAASEEKIELKVDGPSTRFHADQQQGWQKGASVDLFLPGMFWTIVRTVRAIGGNWFKHFIYYQSIGDPAYRFDEALETFERITESRDQARRRSSISEPIYREVSWDFPGSLSSESFTSSSAPFNPVSYVVTQPQPGQSRVPVELGGSQYLRHLAEYTGLQGFSMSLAVEGSYRMSLGEGREALWWRFGAAEFLFTEPGGVTFTHRDLSFGQKRLLAFLYYLDANDHYVIADELVNGMHHRWIEICLNGIGQRQAFLTSQNPLLLDYIPIGSVEDARRTFLQCRTERDGDRSEFVWSNLSNEDAEDLFHDQQVGIQQIGEILRVRGLW